ncbi:MAG: hypothetical protein AAFN77_12730 [Planctomycetota bacterium]
MKFRIASSLTLFALTLTLAGCTGGSSPEQSIADSNQTNCHRLVNLYVRFQTQHRWNGPKDEAEFKAYINEQEPVILSRMGVDASDVESLFVSEVDNAPFVIRYRVRGSARGSNEAVVFEKDGSGGVYRVGFTSSKVEEIEDQARYKGLLDGSIKEPLTSAGPPGGR